MESKQIGMVIAFSVIILTPGHSSQTLGQPYLQLNA